MKSRLIALGIAFVLIFGVACARLPYTTRIIHDSPRALVALRHELKPAGYTQPAQLTADELRPALAGLSIREKRGVPLRWFAEDVPPKRLFRPDELEVLTPLLIEALGQAGPDEHVAFRLLAPGPNPNYDRDTTAGWVAFRDPYLHVEVDYFHTLLPVRRIDQYDYNFPLTEKNPADYLLYFEPGRFWVVDRATGERAIDLRAMSKTGVTGPTLSPAR
jgi:hypothetical protein